MFFTRIPLRNKIIKMIMNNPVPYRNTDILSPYLILSVTFFFRKYKSVIVNELYYKGLINLHGDVELFINAKRARDARYLRIAASITPKGLSYYKSYVLKAGQATEAKKTISTTEKTATQVYLKPTLTIVR